MFGMSLALSIYVMYAKHKQQSADCVESTKQII